MATRRPRIKPFANLMNVKKRKKTVEEDSKSEIVPKDDNIEESKEAVVASPSGAEELNTAYSAHENNGEVVAKCEIVSEGLTEVDEGESEKTNAEIDATTNASFKCPPKVDVALIADDASQPFTETDVIQMDLQKSLNGFPMSPSKSSRQRIRPTPIFGQRRNSFVGSSPSPHTEENSSDFTPPPPQRRERHYSASQSPAAAAATITGTISGAHHYHTPHKFMPSIGGGRIRTESGCSAFSDSYTISSSNKRKIDENSQRMISRKDFADRFTEGIPDKSSLKMFDMIYYNPVSNPMESKANIAALKNESLITEDDNSKMVPKVEPIEKESAMPVPQLKLDANGEPILDHESLVIETTSEQEARKLLAKSTVIFQDENTGMNGFYTRQKRTRHWPPEETIKFFRCLQTVGTDFSLMCKLFPNRSRRDLKLKFKKEERCNGSLINKAILYPKIFNIDDLKTQLDEQEREMDNVTKKWQEIKASKVKKKEQPRGKSAAARTLSNGDDIYRNEHVPKRKFSKRAHAASTTKDSSTLVTDGEKSIELQKDFVKKPKVRRTRRCTPILSVKETSQSSLEFINSEHRKVEESELMEIEVDMEEEMSVLCTDDQTYNNQNLKEDKPIVANMTITGDSLTQFPEDSLILPFDEDDETVMSAILPSRVNIKESLISSDNSQTVINFDNGIVSRLIVLNDDSENGLSKLKEEEIVIPDELIISCEDTYSGRELDETDIQRILEELSEGTLVLVSTLDENNPDRMVNEIYMVDKATGELVDTPLDIPEAIVQGIQSVMCADDIM